MYDKIGEKIKMLAVVIFWIETIAAVSIALARAEDTEGISILIGLAGVVVAWISSWFLYGFGEIIDKLCDIEKNTRIGKSKLDTQSEDDSERIGKIENLRAQGLITEAEYQSAISKE